MAKESDKKVLLVLTSDVAEFLLDEIVRSIERGADDEIFHKAHDELACALDH